ncbi:MAG TPA: SDR family oxidoreductase [Solirubrobacterales bacterium]|nr:SDR family oxidoreductase [Solirubrobacterales bacterium]
MAAPVAGFAGKRCFVTGAASGIGRATAVAAARRGSELYLTDISAEGLEGTAEQIRAAGGRVGYSQAADIADHAAVVAMAAEIHASHGSMDVVMNVAGISVWGTIDRLTHEHWRRVIEIDLIGPVSVLETFVPPMIEAGRGGHIVNVSSAAGLLGLPWHAAYSAAKFGLRGVSEVLRFDLARHDIGVSLVCPGGVKTPLVGTVEIVGVDSESPEIQKLKHRFEKRAVTPEHVAERILAGVEKNRYLVFTSRDIQLAFWLQRWFPPGYELIMRLMNRQLVAVAERA